MNQLIQSNVKTMSSKDLLELINQVRLDFNEKSVRLNDFNNRIQDELEGDHYESFVVQNSNGTDSIIYELTIDQCMLIGMRESKGVRKGVLAKLKNKDREEFYIPQTYGDALQLCADQAKQLEIQAPKVDFYDRVADVGNLMTASVVGKKIGMSAQALNKNLESFKVYDMRQKGRVFNQWFIDQGLGEIKKTDNGFNSSKFTNKGEQWVIEKLVSEGVI